MSGQEGERGRGKSDKRGGGGGAKEPRSALRMQLAVATPAAVNFFTHLRSSSGINTSSGLWQTMGSGSCPVSSLEEAEERVKTGRTEMTKRKRSSGGGGEEEEEEMGEEKTRSRSRSRRRGDTRKFVQSRMLHCCLDDGMDVDVFLNGLQRQPDGNFHPLLQQDNKG